MKKITFALVTVMTMLTPAMLFAAAGQPSPLRSRWRTAPGVSLGRCLPSPLRRSRAVPVLHNVALLLALSDLVRDPAHWRKTPHGKVCRGTSTLAFEPASTIHVAQQGE